MQKNRFLGRWGAFLALWVVLLGLAVLLAGRSRARLDLTEGRIHTISPESERILEGLRDQVTITYYVSSKLPPGFTNLRRDTIDKLEEFAGLSGGRVEVKVVDPLRLVEEHVESRRAEKEGEADPAAEGDGLEDEIDDPAAPEEPSFLAEEEELRWAEEKKQELAQQGIPELQGRSVGTDSFSIERFYSAIEIRYLDRPAERIPVHTALDALEYELASRIVKLTMEEKPKVAFFLGKPDDRIEIPPDPSLPFDMPPRTAHPYEPFLRQVLGDTCTVVEVELTEESPIPEDARVLIVAEPHGLTERQAYEIDRSIARGRPALLLVSRTTGDLENPTAGLEPLAPNLDKTLAEWGISVGRDIVCSRVCGTVPVTREGPLGLRMQQLYPFPLSPIAPPRGLSQENPLTQGLPGLVFPFASEIRVDETALAASGLTLTRLATSIESWLSPWKPSIDQPMITPPSDRPTGEYLLAALLEGTFPSAWEAGAPLPPWSPEPATPEDGEGDAGDAEDAESADAVVPELASSPGTVLVIASADMAKIAALSMYQRQTGNIPFLLGAVESMALGRDLLAIRAKTQQERPLRKTTRGERNLAIWGNLAGVPLLILVVGLARFAARRAGARAFEARFAGKE